MGPMTSEQVRAAADIQLPSTEELNQDQPDQQALGIAEQARQHWNDAKQAQAMVAKQQSAQARELANAVLSHLRTLPTPVRLMTGRLIYEGSRTRT